MANRRSLTPPNDGDSVSLEQVTCSCEESTAANRKLLSTLPSLRIPGIQGQANRHSRFPASCNGLRPHEWSAYGVERDQALGAEPPVRLSADYMGKGQLNVIRCGASGVACRAGDLHLTPGALVPPEHPGSQSGHVTIWRYQVPRDLPATGSGM